MYCVKQASAEVSVSCAASHSHAGLRVIYESHRPRLQVMGALGVCISMWGTCKTPLAPLIWGDLGLPHSAQKLGHLRTPIPWSLTPLSLEDCTAAPQHDDPTASARWVPSLPPQHWGWRTMLYAGAAV